MTHKRGGRALVSARVVGGRRRIAATLHGGRVGPARLHAVRTEMNAALVVPCGSSGEVHAMVMTLQMMTVRMKGSK